MKMIMMMKKVKVTTSVNLPFHFAEKLQEPKMTFMKSQEMIEIVITLKM